MKKLLTVFFALFIINLSFSAKALDLPKYYKFPKNYLKGKKAIVFCTYGSPQFAIRTFF